MTRTFFALASAIVAASITTTAALAYPQTTQTEPQTEPVAQVAAAQVASQTNAVQASTTDVLATNVSTNESLNRPVDQMPTIATPPPPPAPVLQGPDYPVRLVIPSINLDTNIIGVGVNAKGEMDVPDGSTANVGWYKDGTVPGAMGSAVLDAHVFAAFQSLSRVKDGADLYVVMRSGKELHFVAQEEQYYALADVPLQTLFNRTDAPRLNLITCAGMLTPDHSTYDHRLIVYTALAQ